MNRAALLVLSAIAALSVLPLNMAAAKSKAYCRQWAQAEADRNTSSAVSVGATAGNVLTTVGDVLVGTVTVNQGMPAAAPEGPSNTAGAANSKRQQIYRRAYADCRAS